MRKKYYLFKEKIKKNFKEALEQKPVPQEIALGFSIGTAIAILPSFGLGALIGILIAFIYKKINKVALFLSFVFWNPFLLAPLTGLSYIIGDSILEDAPSTTFELEFFNKIFIYTVRYLVGNIILASILTITSYFIVLYISKNYIKNTLQINNNQQL